MRSFLKPPMMLLVAAVGAIQMAATKGELKKEPEKKEPSKEEPAKPPEKVAKAEPGKGSLDLPVPKGQPQKGLTVPVYDLNGIRRMNFRIGTAVRGDDDNIKMSEVRLGIFKEDGSGELDIDLPDSVYNPRTREITSETHVTIKRKDCQITGEKTTFNVETQRGKLSGGVHMIIYNLRAEGGEKTQGAAKPADGNKPREEQKK